MKPENLLDSIGNADSRLVIKAKERKKKHKAAAAASVSIAACLLLTFAFIFFGKNSKGITPAPESEPGSQLTESSEATQSCEETEDSEEIENIVPLEDSAKIYYIKNGKTEIGTKTIIFKSENLFEAWKEFNGIGNEVKIISYDLQSSGKTSVTGSDSSAVMEHQIGDSFTMTLTVSENIKEYFNSVSEELLLETLRKTMTENSGIAVEKLKYTLKFG